MASPASTAEFVDLVRKSGVLDEKRLDAHLEKLRAGATMPTEAGKLAGVLVRDGLLTHFQAEQFMLGKWRRFTIGKYKVLERLGSGGMGSVYLCEHKLMRRRVAVKVLPTAKASDPSALERFYREARAAAALDHPNIVHAYDIDQDENLHFLVMEYVDGASLQELVKRSGPLSPVRAAHYIGEASLGLHHAHLSGLVHRDIKPGNILVDRTGVVKILDMGLARFFKDEEDILTKKYDENVLGTADYLAPEQALDSHGVDIRADIYSMGATFYFCLTGRTPFSEGSVAQKLIWHQTRQPKPIRSTRPEVPEEMTAIIDKMMSKDPDQRYQTPLEVAEALKPWLDSPIGPPSEAEMPRLSLAATGVAPGEATQIGSPPTGMPSPAPGKNWQVPSPGSKPPSKPRIARSQTPAPTPGASPAPAAAAASAAVPQSTAVPRPAPIAAPQAAQADEESIPWEKMTSDTDDPSAHLDTAPRSTRKVGSPSRTGSTSRLGASWWHDRRRLYIVIGGVAVVVVVGLIVLLTRLTGGHPTKKQGRPPIQVKPGESIQAAIRKARPGDRIVVEGGTYAERITLRQVSRISLEKGEGDVTLIPPPNHNPKDPLLNLETTKDARIVGLKFDGQGKVQHLVKVTLANSGLVLEGLMLKSFTEAAVVLVNCAGTSAQPVILRGLEITPPDLNKPKPALVIKLNPSLVGVKVNDHIHVENWKPNGSYTPENPAIKHDPKDLGSDIKFPGTP
jgi:serine/threonine protein kinase